MTIPLIVLTIGLGFFVEQSDFVPIISQFGIFFFLYIFIFKYTNKKNKIIFFVGVSVLLRLILLFAIPNLSDDVYRFIWDGRLLINGHNPFDYSPIYYIENNISIPGINEALYTKLNSPKYFTIYPPIAQSVFASACWLFPNSIFGSVVVMKTFLFLSELGSLLFIKKLLHRFQIPEKNILLYALNPLIIIELCGNLHFEAVMICFLLAGVFFLVESKLIFSAFSIALSIASKLLPLMFLPFFIKRLGLKKSIQYFSIVGIVTVLLFIPLLSGEFFNNFRTSLDLYFQKFEFNASIYYTIRWVGYQMVGFNWIQSAGPTLGVIVLLGIVAITFLEKNINWKDLFGKMLFAICLYISLATVVHPWYVSLPIVLSLFTRYRFPILWSGLIFLTYINYSYETYSENLWVVGIEYVLVYSFLFYEMTKTHSFFQLKNQSK